MRRLYFLIIFICLIATSKISTANAEVQAPPLSPEAWISILTSSPSDEAAYALYGHTALRVCDTIAGIDIVFNYGIFDFSKPNFIYRFAKGETDYMLGVNDFNSYLFSYMGRGSEVCEQVLNLSQEEKEALWQALIKNERPENRVYRYNFFFDNCATRPVVMIENNLSGTIEYAPLTQKLTFRDVINHCTREHPWITFGCDLVMGIPTDRVMTLKETFFIPEYLKNAFANAKIVRDGTAEPLIIKTNILNEESLTAEQSQSPLASPLACFSLIFLIILVITWHEWHKIKHYRLADCILFFIAGIAGCIIFFLSFMSVHPGMFPNISLMWLHPLHLIGVLFFSVKKYNRMAFWYHFINFAAILIMAVAWIFIPQHFNIAFIPLIACLWVRSGWALLRKMNSTR